MNTYDPAYAEKTIIFYPFAKIFVFFGNVYSTLEELLSFCLPDTGRCCLFCPDSSQSEGGDRPSGTPGQQTKNKLSANHKKVSSFCSQSKESFLNSSQSEGGVLPLGTPEQQTKNKTIIRDFLLLQPMKREYSK